MLFRNLTVLAVFSTANCFFANPVGATTKYAAVLLPVPMGFVSTAALDGFQAAQVGRGAGSATDGNFHALLWTNGASSVIDLHPNGYTYSFAGSVYDSYQVGWVGGPSPERATMWQGTSDSVVDLHPAGFDSSNAYGISETNQVGWAFRREPHGDHAMIWSGTADSAVDLHPRHYIQSRAYEVSGSSQVGYAVSSRGGLHAALWEETPESFVDLHPPGFVSSFARSVEGAYQVGSGRLSGGRQRALLWQGSDQNVIHLHPPGFASSSASDVSGNTQVGFGIESYLTPDKALLWHSSAESFVDLHQYVLELDSGFLGSRAHDIEPNGDVFGEVWNESGRFAVKWSVVPEPSTQFLVLCVSFAVLSCRRYDASA